MVCSGLQLGLCPPGAAPGPQQPHRLPAAAGASTRRRWQRERRRCWRQRAAAAAGRSFCHSLPGGRCHLLAAPVNALPHQKMWAFVSALAAFACSALHLAALRRTSPSSVVLLEPLLCSRCAARPGCQTALQACGLAAGTGWLRLCARRCSAANAPVRSWGLLLRRRRQSAAAMRSSRGRQRCRKERPAVRC